MIESKPWTPDLPDFRDRSVSGEEWGFLDRVVPTKPSDHSEFFLPVDKTEDGISSAAVSVGGLMEYFNRRFEGDMDYLSKRFISDNAQRIQNAPHADMVSIRSALKVVAKLGAPPARFSNPCCTENDAFLYSFQSCYSNVKYYRVDTESRSPKKVLLTIKKLLATGNLCVFGFPLMLSVTNDGFVDFRRDFDQVHGSSTGILVGHDDEFRISACKGAFRFRSTFGEPWGESGYGWLDYRYIKHRLLRDIWTITKPEWRE